MKTQDAYNRWAKTYDSVVNKTRDLEKKAIRQVLQNQQVAHLIEIGCGTGKNTEWLAGQCSSLTALDFSEEMLALARAKIGDPKIKFEFADITKPWTAAQADLITCSLVLEHIQDLEFIFMQAAEKLETGGRFFICELHPYKQLQGSRARFEEDGETIHLEYFVHHLSEYMSAALENKFNCIGLLEWFDNDHQAGIPRLVSFLFQKA